MGIVRLPDTRGFVDLRSGAPTGNGTTYTGNDEGLSFVPVYQDLGLPQPWLFAVLRRKVPDSDFPNAI